MFLHGLNNVCPPFSMTQEECFEALSQTETYARLREGSQMLLRKVLFGSGGIARRSFVSDRLKHLSVLDAGELNALFESEGARLGAEALSGALEKAECGGAEIDALLVCSCTGYLCPGLSSYVAERLGLRRDIQLIDMVGQGCGAAIPTLRQAQACLAAGAGKVACVAVEICSAAFYLEDDAGVIISLCLFGDGASASVWSEKAKPGSPDIRISGYQSLHWPEHREELRFANARGKLKNILTREVPETAARAVKQLFEGKDFQPEAVLAHPGGKNVLNALRSALPGHAFAESARILERHGNMSSPSVLFVLEEWLRNTQQHSAWMVSFGAGFTCHACRVERGPVSGGEITLQPFVHQK